MATGTAVRLGQAAMGVLATLYTCPVDTTAILKSFDICNTTPAPIRVRVFIVPDGDTADADTALVYDFLVPANSLFGWEGEQVLEVDDTIQIYGSAAGCTITASGVQIA